MTVLPLPDRGRWVWDARDRTRAVRVSTHGTAGLLNLSLWRDDVCVGTVKLRPDEAAELVGALTEGLARLTGPPAPDAARLAAVEDRLAGLEARLHTPPARRAVDDARAAAAALVGRLLRRLG
ncbi:hypothetical protein [Geodermatophilus sp. DSM 44513]|uniref:hypothetical protein n=1 Tax=Geodermatophilus sp. DSM 44513 TaxID=1528104 RepID=UPI0028F713E9|nr:hypothetical protein [Geodermatophilus sp. DSM 44513]WNV73710.1 hypothetical protein RTG05_12020 [Geodermatophilus sp. DSM 44513]